MPLVEKIAGGTVHVRGAGRFSYGDRADVDDEMAAYLCEERGDFKRVDATDVEFEEVGEDDVDDAEEDAADDLESKTVDELQDLAAEADVSGRSSMNKDELIAELRDEHEE